MTYQMFCDSCYLMAISYPLNVLGGEWFSLKSDRCLGIKGIKDKWKRETRAVIEQGRYIQWTVNETSLVHIMHTSLTCSDH